MDGEITLSELKIQLEKDNLNDLIQMGLSVGMEYQEIMKLDNKNFFMVYMGKLKYIERLLNSCDDLNNMQSIKIAQALLNAKEFNKGFSEYKISRETTAEKISRIASNDNISREDIRNNILKG